MPTIMETPSRGRMVRFQEPPEFEQDTAGAGGLDTGGDRGAVGGGGGHGGHPAQSFELQEDPSFWKDHNVQVVIRIRPLSSSEISLQGHNRCVRQDSYQSITWTGHPESRFTFDLIADEYVSQEKLFKVAGVPMVDNCISGYNSCMFAYGQTGSGKTHTMLGDIEGGTRRHSVNCGMTPRVFEYLFSKIQKEKESRREEKLQFTCKCSFLEIYNEQILDLLDPSSVNLQTREDAKRGVHVENLKEFEVTSARDVMQQLLQGAANRKVAATNMNRASSRSHSVFTCVIESKWESQGISHHRFSRLNLVDLAGSERQKSSGAEGERLKEATNINKSLSTLGLVIMNLVSISNKKSLHVPYRDSKLTFLLQDSLGGNSKTIIIANISPSSCCALETLSTMKFAQRAKFIRNNAIVNEEASGDVLTMRLQIQQLKKEVNRLRCLVNGGSEHHESDSLNAAIPGSPGSFKWEGIQGSFSPLTFDKRISQRKEYDAALVAAFRRDQDKEKVLKALTAEKEAAEQLASQRTDEVQGLKMRLRFREEGIKRLEAVASAKLSAESHLLQEKEELSKEIEILRNQVDRNPEVTRFAMENLRLKEELRSLQSFVEEGEREMMNEQITALQEKLLEALDWKLMHEKGLGVQDLSLSWDSSINEENEFLRLQAIQNQREVEALRKNLNFCLEAKEKLERHVDELELQLEDERKLHSSISEATEPQQAGGQLADGQIELKTMVDAIAAASQREAEAHETAITLAKENEELRLKLNVLIEDNNKLIELYENAVSEDIARKANKTYFETSEDQDKGFEDLNISHEKKGIENLENQLHEMHEENEKLMSLYEQAMQERDEFKRLLHEQKNGQREEESSCFEKLVEVDNRGICFHNKSGETSDALHPEFVNLTQEKLDLATVKLEMVHDKLATVERVMCSFRLFEQKLKELNNLSERIRISDCGIQSKQEQVASLKIIYGETQGRKSIMENKLLAAKFALQKLSPEIVFWRRREEQARTKLDAHLKLVEQKKKELEVLLSQKVETDAAYRQASQSESQLRDKLNSLKVAYKVAEGQREETKKVLFAIDNLEKADIPSQRAGQYGKAFELLKSEEEVTKLAAEVKQSREKLATVQKEAVNSRKMSEELDSKLKDLEKEMESESLLLDKAEIEFQKVKGEIEAIATVRKEGTTEFWDFLVDYQESVFLLDVKETEIQMREKELQLEMITIEELKMDRSTATQRLDALLEECKGIFLLSDADGCSQGTGGNVVGALGNMQGDIAEARSLLFDRNDDR